MQQCRPRPEAYSAMAKGHTAAKLVTRLNCKLLEATVAVRSDQTLYVGEAAWQSQVEATRSCTGFGEEAAATAEKLLMRLYAGVTWLKSL